MNKSRVLFIRLSCLLAAFFLFINPIGLAQSKRTSFEQINSSINAKDLETLLDPIFSEQMEKLHIPGAVVAVVKDGKIIFTKGYGVSDIEKKTPVIPDKTIFRIGSITKVFTATAVMQLTDRGKIDLNDDVNKYLKDFKVPDIYPQPITFANLLTHTSGLDEISPGRRTSDVNKIVPLGSFLKTRLVRQNRPGEIISYSTYSSALAGFLVEQITGTSFKTYLSQNIFEPLKMNRTSIAAIKAEHAEDLASGYEYGENKYEKLPFQWFNTYPASDINSTATDMAHFMMAHLSGGTFEGKSILSRKATSDMHTTHFRNHPRINGWAYGFYEGERNNLRFVEHGGTMDDGYSALITLVPKQNFGIFVACNTEAGGEDLGSAVKTAVFNRYFPASDKPGKVEQTIKQSRTALEHFAGKYRGYIYCHSCSANEPGAYVPAPVEITVNDEGTLSFRDERWRQIEPLLFELASGPRAGKVLLAFRENAGGKITYMFQDTFRTYERLPN